MDAPRAAQSLYDELGPELWREILQVFVDSLADRVAAIRTAADAGDAETLADEAHSFKGSCLTLDLSELAECSRRIELGAQAGMVCREDVAALEALAQPWAATLRSQLGA